MTEEREGGPSGGWARACPVSHAAASAARRRSSACPAPRVSSRVGSLPPTCHPPLAAAQQAPAAHLAAAHLAAAHLHLAAAHLHLAAAHLAVAEQPSGPLRAPEAQRAPDLRTVRVLSPAFSVLSSRFSGLGSWSVHLRVLRTLSGFSAASQWLLSGFSAASQWLLRSTDLRAPEAQRTPRYKRRRALRELSVPERERVFCP